MYTEDLVIQIQWARSQTGRVHVPDTRHHNAWMYIVRRALAKAAMLWRACFWDLTTIAIYMYLVVQMDLSMWKVVCCGKLILHWTLDRWQRPSRWTNHAITRQQRIDSKILQNRDWRYCSLWPMLKFLALTFSRCRETARETYTHTHTQDDYRMPPGLCPPRYNNPTIHVCTDLRCCSVGQLVC